MLVSLRELRQQSRKLADMERTGFVQDNETDLDWRINRAGEEFYALIADSAGPHLALSQSAVSVSGQSLYTLPAPIKRLSRVFYDGKPIQPLQWSEIPPTAGKRRYRQEGMQSFFFAPTPDTAGTSIQIRYFPYWTDLVAEADEAECWDFSEYLALTVAIQLLGKEESDPSALVMRKQEVTARIKIESSRSDNTNGQPVIDADGWGHADCNWSEW